MQALLEKETPLRDSLLGMVQSANPFGRSLEICHQKATAEKEFDRRTGAKMIGGLLAKFRSLGKEPGYPHEMECKSDF